MRLAIPSLSSRLNSVAVATLAPLLGVAVEIPQDRSLALSPIKGVDLLLCRGMDIPQLVIQGVADAGLTGYDAAVEAVLATNRALDIRSLAGGRTSFVCLAAVAEIDRTARIYTEYPMLAERWSRATRICRKAEIVTLRGSLEGIVSLEPASAAFVLVTSGSTLQANGLNFCLPILTTDLCVVSRGADGESFERLKLGRFARLELPAFCQAIRAEE